MRETLSRCLERGPILTTIDIGIPTIHDLSGCRHLGFGMFELRTADYTLTWDAGSALLRTPSGKGYTYLSIKGDYPYDSEAVRTKLAGYLPPQTEPPSPDAHTRPGPTDSTPHRQQQRNTS